MYSFVIVAVGNGIIFLQALALEMFVEISLVTWHLGGFGIGTEWEEADGIYYDGVTGLCK